MNIHFKDIILFNSLKHNTILKLQVGSNLYNLSNSNSDTDYLYIYLESPKNLKSFQYEHHQLQFKEDNIDHNFTSIQSFIRNILTGDSTINFEVLFSPKFKKDFKFLYDFRYNFINYNIIKSYLGLAKRDLKLYRKSKCPKKLSHFIRGVMFADYLLNDGDLYLDNTNKFTNGISDFKILYDIKNNLLSLDIIDDYIELFENKMNILRDISNKKLENKEICRVMSPNHLMELDKYIKSLSKDLVQIDYKDIYFNVLENGLSYS